MNLKLKIVLLSLAYLIRWLVAQHPYSGQSKPPMYGDYEAQRHWMEITTNIPVADWYKNTTDNDLQYWGLDYPPLTAYHMMAIGLVAEKLNSSWTQLHLSRGTESYAHKLFMRLSVMIPDLLLHLTAIIYYHGNTYSETTLDHAYKAKDNRLIYTILTLLYPGQILIDHGHFQYNCVFLGISLWAVISVLQGRLFIGAFLFTLALNYKQMALYYALPFFWFIFSTNMRKKPVWKGIANVLLTGLLVIFTTGVCFYPFASNVDSISQVVQRLFPFNRGLFEDKVANLWCSLSILIKLKNLYANEYLLKISLLATILSNLPTGIHLLWKPTTRNFKYSLVNSSLAFFLFSFQVHEKTILIPMLPILMLYKEHPVAVNWFSIISTFSLHPLLIKDGQNLTFYCLISTFITVSFEIISRRRNYAERKLFSVENLSFWMYIASCTCCLFISMTVPYLNLPRYPDLYAMLNSLISFAHFICFLLFFNFKQFKSGIIKDESQKITKTKKVK